MNKKISVLKSAVIAVAILFSICASTATAQNSAKSSNKLERERLSRVMDTGANIEEFRVEYLNYLTELQENMRLFNAVPAVQLKLNRAGLRPIAMLTAAKVSVSEMSQEDLTKIRAVYAKFPGWREMPQSLISPEVRQALQANLKAKIEGGAATNAATTDNCADGINAGVTNTDISIAKAAEIAAEAVMEALPTDGITIAARLIPVGLHAAAQGATLALETLKGIKDDCRDDAFQDDITAKVNAIPGLISTSTSTTATNITTAQTAIINNDNANKTAIINNDNANKNTIVTTVENAKTTIIVNANANKEELIRLHIGADLASTDSSVLVAAFMLPAAKGGYLELTRSVVFDALTNLAGYSTAQANSILAQGDAARNSGDYKGAYTAYRKAYKTATK